MPVFIEAHHIDYSKVTKISRFRSLIGHDNSDDFEHCRSMKHYFQPTELVSIYSPVTGTITESKAEMMYGFQVVIRPTNRSYVAIRIFHLAAQVAAGTAVTAGQLLGTHATLETQDDIAVELSTKNGLKLVSYFDVMPDALFAQLGAYGITNRSQLIISKRERDADAVACSTGNAFSGSGRVPNVVSLPSGALSLF